MTPLILKLDIAGTPSAWIHWQEAAVLYARERVRWEAGQKVFTFRGGRRASGERSSLAINSIIATDERCNRLLSRSTPPSRKAVFLRDGMLCLYCGKKFRAEDLTVDHIRPVSKGGDNSWENLATCCRRENQLKGDKDLAEAKMSLIAVPYRPDPAALLLLMNSGRRITACQQAWLEATAKKGSRPQ